MASEKFQTNLKNLTPEQLRDVQQAVNDEAAKRKAADPDAEFRRKVANMSDREFTDLKPQ